MLRRFLRLSQREGLISSRRDAGCTLGRQLNFVVHGSADNILVSKLALPSLRAHHRDRAVLEVVDHLSTRIRRLSSIDRTIGGVRNGIALAEHDVVNRLRGHWGDLHGSRTAASAVVLEVNAVLATWRNTRMTSWLI